MPVESYNCGNATIVGVVQKTDSGTYYVALVGTQSGSSSIDAAGLAYVPATAGLYGVNNLNAGAFLNIYTAATYPISMLWITPASYSSGTAKMLSLLPVYDQESGTAANTDLFSNRTEGQVGSGTQLLGDLQVNSVSRWNVDNLGQETTANPNLGARVLGCNTELITLSTSGTTTNSITNLLPANSVIEAVAAYVTTTITTATNWSLGDATIATRFCAAQTNLASGSTVVGLKHVDQSGTSGPIQSSANTLRITTTGTPGAGAIRVSVFYRTYTAPSGSLGTLMFLGDSRTDPMNNTWPATLNSALTTATSFHWGMANGGASGSGVISTFSTISGIIAQYDRLTVSDRLCVLINLGVNDVTSPDPGGLPVQATWIADYESIIDTITTRWPRAHIWLMKPWKRDFDANMATVAGWINTIQAARSSYVSIGPDESVWLKGSDNGNTYTSDGIHYSAAGEALCATQWQSVLGY